MVSVSSVIERITSYAQFLYNLYYLKKRRWKKHEHVKKSKRSSEKLKSNFKDTNKTIFIIKMISVVGGKRGKRVTAEEKLSSLELKTKPGKQSRVPSLKNDVK